jgi:glutathione S-transferase
MFFEEDFIQNGLASLRYWTMTGKSARRSPELIAAKQAISRKTLAILERCLQGGRFLTDAGYSIADMSVFAYIHRAGDAGIDLAPYPAVTAWIERIRSQPRYLETIHPYSIDPDSSNELP